MPRTPQIRQRLGGRLLAVPGAVIAVPVHGMGGILQAVGASTHLGSSGKEWQVGIRDLGRRLVPIATLPGSESREP